MRFLIAHKARLDDALIQREFKKSDFIELKF